MTTIEKFTAGVLVLIVSLWVGTAYIMFSEIDEAGGVRAIIVDTGKEIKSILDEINDESERTPAQP